GHSDDLNALLAIDEPVVDLFDTVRIFESSNGIREVNAVFAKIFGRFATIPFVLHTRMVPDTRSDGNGTRTVLSCSHFRNERRAQRSGVKWRAMADENGHYCFAMPL